MIVTIERAKWFEGKVLGRLVLDWRLKLRIEGILEAKDFLEPFEQMLFSKMMEKELDLVGLMNELDENLYSHGDFFLKLDEWTKHGNPAEIENYCGYVKEEALKRKRMAGAAQMMVHLSEGTTQDYEVSLGLLNALEVGNTSLPVTMNDAVDDFLAYFDESMAKDGTITGISTGLPDLDDLTSGIHEQDLVILGARTSCGKTALALNLAQNMGITHGKKVLYFNLEMSAIQVMSRTLSRLSQLPLSNIMSPNRLPIELREPYRQAMVKYSAQLLESPLLMISQGCMSLAEIKARSWKQKRGGGLDCIYIDLFNKIKMEGSYENDTSKASNLIEEIKEFGRSINVPIVLMAQLNRESDKGSRKPKISDIKHSSTIEQVADVVLLLHREYVYNKEANKDIADLEVAKNRNGPTGEIKLRVDLEIMEFSHYVPDAFYKRPT